MIYGLREADREAVLAEMGRQAREMKIPMQVTMSSDSAEEITGALEEISGVSVLWIFIGISEGKIDREPIDLGRTALRNNRDHYIVYLLQSSSMLEKASVLCSRHFGILVCPPKENLVRASCKRILTDYSEMIEPEEDAPEDWLVVQNGRAYQRLPIREIEYVEALNKKLNIYLNDSVITVYDTLAELSEQLGDRFFRTHRSYIVNVSKIRRVNLVNLEMEMESGSFVPIARARRQESRELIEELGGRDSAG